MLEQPRTCNFYLLAMVMKSCQNSAITSLQHKRLFVANLKHTTSRHLGAECVDLQFTTLEMLRYLSGHSDNNELATKFSLLVREVSSLFSLYGMKMLFLLSPEVAIWRRDKAAQRWRNGSNIPAVSGWR